DVYDKYAAMADAIFTAGPDHVWAAGDSWTKEQQDDFWAKLKAEWMYDVQGIVNYVNANYLDSYGEEIMGMPPADISANEGLKIAFGMALWGFGEVVDGVFTTAVTGTTFDLETTFPTIEDYYNETYAAYEGDPVAYASVESANETDVLGNVNSDFIGFWGPKDESMGGKGVPNIAGIVKVDDYTVEVTVNGFSAPAVYSILGIQVTPLHYYGDVAKYDYANNKFGFDFGDLSKQESLTATPMGGGAYKFVKYDNRIVYFEANEFYYRGCPKIKEIQFKETVSAEVASAVQTGTVDAGEMTGSRSRFEEVASYNSNGDITGDKITTSKVDNLGYGYAGINADTVNVAGDPGSDASKNLRKALGTILAVYRDVAIDSYYGEAASVINYPISNTSWAAPQPTDEDYKVAFSTDVAGNPIYTADMTPEDKYAAAETAALGFFEAAGFTVAGGKVTAAPDGAKLSYEVIVPGGGTGDHPAFAILTGAQGSLDNIGMELKINDPADSNILWDALDASTQELWTAAWGATIDPDMYQVYHSSGVVGAGGSDSNHYHIRDAQLDQLIVDARKSDDQNYRKAIYKQALDIIIDWAVEIPTYQRQNCVIFSTERIKIDTLTPDITTFWGWLNDIELVEMY
ncbi:MAG: ABC transporter substrate-binding protein, partial [Anaerolineaceae bacterium]|nr:ABC transporter substrate-binding protein [Anaerolineaceae bacterium]